MVIVVIQKDQQDQTELIWKTWNPCRGSDYHELLASVEGHTAASFLMTPALVLQAVAHHDILVEAWVEVERNARVITQVDAEPGGGGWENTFIARQTSGIVENIILLSEGCETELSDVSIVCTGFVLFG